MREIARAIVLRDGFLLSIKRNKYGDEFYSLPGGGIEPNETAEAAVIREVFEETSIRVSVERLIFIEKDDRFGEQYYFLCPYLEGEPALHPGSEESIETAAGENTYTPVWLPVDTLELIEFRPSSVKIALLEALSEGFPNSPKRFATSS